MSIPQVLTLSLIGGNDNVLPVVNEDLSDGVLEGWYCLLITKYFTWEKRDFNHPLLDFGYFSAQGAGRDPDIR
jgi:hypothetical protein